MLLRDAQDTNCIPFFRSDAE